MSPPHLLLVGDAWVLFFFFRFLYFEGRVTQREKQRKRTLTVGSLPRGYNKEPGAPSSSHTWVPETGILGPSPAVSQTLFQGWIRIRVAET